VDADLQSIQEARDLVARGAAAQQAFAQASQDRVDAIVSAMASAADAAAESLARTAVDETRMGVYEHKIIKNRFASRVLLEYILPMRTVGVLREDPARKVRELAVPMGVVGAIVPTTNPTSTAIYKALIAVKARNAIVMSPHPRAVKCTVDAGRVLESAAVTAGAPPGLVGVMTTPTIEGTNALMRHRDTAVILATGGADMVRAVYTAGKPAYGVGPGNVPRSLSAPRRSTRPWPTWSMARPSTRVSSVPPRTPWSWTPRSNPASARHFGESGPTSVPLTRSEPSSA
jgi:acetaldehyde dehydrogenase (acetylating)